MREDPAVAEGHCIQRRQALHEIQFQGVVLNLLGKDGSYVNLMMKTCDGYHPSASSTNGGGGGRQQRASSSSSDDIILDMVATSLFKRYNRP